MDWYRMALDQLELYRPASAAEDFQIVTSPSCVEWPEAQDRDHKLTQESGGSCEIDMLTAAVK